MDDILLIDKPEGITTYDIIRRIKNKFPKGTKIGHTGTLDPFATGLVILLLGKATKRQDEFHKFEKEYIATGIFGIETDTQDKLGNIVQEVTPPNISDETIQKEISRFVGSICQLPPQFSAKQVNGVRAYDLARKGEKVELKPVTVEIKRFEIISYDWPEVTFDVVCSGGTYIRTLIHDLGRSLETCATCKALRRVRVGEYNIENAVKLEAYVNER